MPNPRTPESPSSHPRGRRFSRVWLAARLAAFINLIVRQISIGNNPVTNKRKGVELSLPFYTIDHWTRPLETFRRTATRGSVVADIRTVPKSRTNPQYNKEPLLESLAAFQVTYNHIAELGGLRGKAKVSRAK